MHLIHVRCESHLQLLYGFQQRHPNVVFPEIPERGSFDLKEVLLANYFFD